MTMGRVGRFVLTTMLAGGLLTGVWTGVASAGSVTEQEYSESDCEIMQNLKVEGDQSGYYGKTALNASKVYGDAAEELEDEDLAGRDDDVVEDVGQGREGEGRHRCGEGSREVGQEVLRRDRGVHQGPRDVLAPDRRLTRRRRLDVDDRPRRRLSSTKMLA